MTNESSIRATAAAMKDKTSIAQAVGKKRKRKTDKDRKGSARRSEREKRVLALWVALAYRIKVLPL